MANQMRTLCDVSLSWDEKLLPVLPFPRTIDRSQNTIEYFSQWNTQGKKNTLNGHFVKAMMSFHEGDTGDVCVIEVGKGQYAAEHTSCTGETIIVTGNAKGQLYACRIASDGTLGSLMITKACVANLAPLYAVYIMLIAKTDITGNNAISHDCDVDFARFMKCTDLADVQKELFYLNDTLYSGFKYDKIKGQIQNGNISMLTEDRIRNLSGTLICGTPCYLCGGKKTPVNVLHVKDVKAMFSDFAKGRKWTPEQEKFIPSFSDDYPVVPEVVKIAQLYTKSRNALRPMNNFLWRGITSYGKSTGAELLACILHTPLLRVTCKSTMDTEDFKSQYVPDSGKNGKQASDSVPEIPYMEFIGDPASAYEKLTGEYRDDMTFESALDEYIRRKTESAAAASKAKGNSSAPRYILVDPNYIKALKSGYILEIQEISRIKDPGVLVGLNEYDRAGAVIELPDGTYVKRHQDAMVIFTDNVGYASCRAVDPSVMRRMDYVFDSREVPDEQMIARVKYNTGFADDGKLAQMLKVLKEVVTYCRENDLHEGDISVNELERWVQVLQIEGDSAYESGCRGCLVSKVSSDYEIQDDLMNHLLESVLSEVA